jgi:hypothetical protein
MQLLGSTSDTFDDHCSPVKDQCIFVNYFKLKKRLFLPRKLEAAANSSNIDGSEPSDGGSATLADIETEMGNTVTAVSNLLDARLTCY